MKIVIIGSGNVAQIFARAFLAAGEQIVQMIARNKHELENFCSSRQIPFSTDFININAEADLYIIAVADQALEEICNQFSLKNVLVVHTAGSMPETILQKITNRTGVFYPLQSLKKEMSEIPPLSLLVHASQDGDQQILENLAQKIAEKVMLADDEQRAKYHLAAVITNNFSNHLYALAYKYCEKNQIEFKSLLPMLKEQINRLENFTPQQVQTGPAIRRDENVIQKHLSALDGELKFLYEWFTASIQKNS